jgi:hypothetical protein
MFGRRLTVLAAMSMLGAAAQFAPAATAAAAQSGWHWTKPYTVPGRGIDSINGLACPTTSLCVAVSSNKVLWTTKPNGKRSAWKHVALESSTQNGQVGVILDDVTCPSARFCLAADDLGNGFVTSHPTGGKSAWHEYAVDQIEILSVDCSSATLCAALDYYGNALTTTQPNGGAWHYVAIAGSAPDLTDVSCAGPKLCAAVEFDKHVFVTTNPGAATPKWHAINVGGPGWSGVACAGGKCVAVGGSSKGVIGVSTHPAAGKSAWKHFTVPEVQQGVDCATAKSCLSIGGSGRSSTTSTGKASAWHAAGIPGTGSEIAVSCPGPKHCFVGTSTTQFIHGAR